MSNQRQVPAPPSDDYVRYIPLGGLDEVGLNCALIECNGSMLMVDCGLTFPETREFGVDILIPDWTYVMDNLDKLDGIVITHGHEDHIGAAPYFLKEVDVPVYSGELTLGMLNRKLQSHGLGNDVDLYGVEPGDQLEIGPFVVEFISINHSVPNAMAIALHTPLGTALVTGDWKLDQTPVFGEPADLARLAELGDGDMLALFGDSTNANVPGFSTSEKTVQRGFSDVIDDAPGRVIVGQFSSNIYRVAALLQLAYEKGRKVALLGTSLVKNTNIARDLGYFPLPPEDVLINPRQIDDYADDELLIASTGSQAEPRSSLARMAHGDHRAIDIKDTDTVVLSARRIPGNEYGINSMVNNLLKRGAKVITASDAPIHCSGHGKQGEMKLIMNLTRPKYLVPVHGEFRMRQKHAELGQDVGIDQSMVIDNGDVLEFTKDSARVIGHVHHGRLLVDGRNIGDPEDFQLHDRRKLANAGIVVAYAVLDRENGELIEPPQLLQHGVIGPADSDDLLAGAARSANDAVDALSDNARRDISEVKEAIRLHVRQYLRNHINRRPVVTPVVHQL